MGTHETTAHLSGHQGAIYDALWDPNTRTWLTAGGDGIVAEWHAQGTGEGRALLHHEKAFFKKAVGGADPLISALRKLYVENLSHPLPHPLMAGFHYSHPTLLEREGAMKKD